MLPCSYFQYMVKVCRRCLALHQEVMQVEHHGIERMHHECLMSSTPDLILEHGHRKVTKGNVLQIREPPVEQPTSPVEDVSPPKGEASPQIQLPLEESAPPVPDASTASYGTPSKMQPPSMIGSNPTTDVMINFAFGLEEVRLHLVDFRHKVLFDQHFIIMRMAKTC